jgi:hypothetical protein
METTTSHGPLILTLAKVCHGCGICARAERKPLSPFGRLMRWHREWCPAWAAHSKVHGPKTFVSSDREAR